MKSHAPFVLVGICLVSFILMSPVPPADDPEFASNIMGASLGLIGSMIVYLMDEDGSVGIRVLMSLSVLLGIACSALAFKHVPISTFRFAAYGVLLGNALSLVGKAFMAQQSR